MSIKKLNWDTTKEEMITIHKIAKRAQFLEPRISMLDMEMDITACHKNGCELRLEDLLKADDFNFAHDVFGISRNIDRTTGVLQNCFLPRFAS